MGNNNKIKALWVRAHGTPLAISLSRYAEINVAPPGQFDQIFGIERIRKARMFLQDQLKKLEPDAPVVLESCYTGQKMEDNKENIAQFIANVAGGRKVYAPSREAIPINKSMTYTPEQGFKVIIKSFQSSTYFAKGSCLGRICAVWHAFRNHLEDITCEFQVENLP